MTKLINLGSASEETKGTFYSPVHVDPQGEKIVDNGIRYRSKPEPPDELPRVQDMG